MIKYAKDKRDEYAGEKYNNKLRVEHMADIMIMEGCRIGGEIRLKPADEGDIEPIYNLNKELIDKYENRELINYKKVLAWVRQNIEAHINGYTCVMYGGNKAGYYYFHQGGGQERMEMDDFYILPPYQGLGIGTSVFRDCLRGVTIPVVLYVFIKNVRAVCFYQRLGFEITGTIRSMYIMQRNPGLTPAEMQKGV